MAVLETRALTRRFDQLTAVDAVNLSVDHGEVFGLLGPNGAGKTTLVKMLTTLLPPSEGSASVAGHDIGHEATEVRRQIGYVPQMLSADGTLTGYENLLISAKLYDIPRGERHRRIHDALAFMGLTEAAERQVRQYSGGMIRRLEIAQATLHRPQLMFLDEPTVGLDPLARMAVWEHIQKLRSEFGTSILLTTHLMEEADNLCNRVAIMHMGKVVALGTPKDLKATIDHGGRNARRRLHPLHRRVLWVREVDYREAARTRRTARRMG